MKRSRYDDDDTERSLTLGAIIVIAAAITVAVVIGLAASANADNDDGPDGSYNCLHGCVIDSVVDTVPATEAPTTTVEVTTTTEALVVPRETLPVPSTSSTTVAETTTTMRDAWDAPRCKRDEFGICVDQIQELPATGQGNDLVWIGVGVLFVGIALLFARRSFMDREQFTNDDGGAA